MYWKRFFLSILSILATLIFSRAEAHFISIHQYPIEWTENRLRLMEEYSLEHYGRAMTEIEPRAIVVHWTASATLESVMNTFYPETMYDGSLNVASHFVVDRDGKIYQLTPETALNRHAIGYNWCAIGIENVGGVNGEEDLTDAQLAANISLIRHMRNKFPTIEYVFGHYQQNIARQSGLYLELVPDYYAEKIDPGAKFMRGLREALSNSSLKFFPE